MVERPLGLPIETEGFVSKISVQYLFFRRKHISEVQPTAREMFGARGIPSMPTELILSMNLSAPAFRRRIKNPATCLSSLNSECPFKQNPTGQRLLFVLMESDQKPQDSLVSLL